MQTNTAPQYTVLVDDIIQDVTSDLSAAIRCWDAVTFATDAPAPGGIQVREWDAAGNMTRDGWILHVQPSGVVYLNPNLSVV